MSEQQPVAMPDARKPWEVEYSLRVKFAASYLDIMDTTGTKRQLATTAYGANGDLDKWCKERIEMILARCSQLVADNGPLSIAALSVVRASSERLHERGLFGNALAAGTMKIDEAPVLDS